MNRYRQVREGMSTKNAQLMRLANGRPAEPGDEPADPFDDLRREIAQAEEAGDDKAAQVAKSQWLDRLTKANTNPLGGTQP